MLSIDYYRGHKDSAMLNEARGMADDALKPHMLTARKNYHRCLVCFDCAAAQVARERLLAIKRNS